MKKAKITSSTLRKLFAGNEEQDGVFEDDLSVELEARLSASADEELPVVDTSDDNADLDIEAEFEDEEPEETGLTDLASGDNLNSIQDEDDGLDELTPVDSTIVDDEEICAEDEELTDGDMVADALGIGDSGDVDVVTFEDEVLAVKASVIVAKMSKKAASRAGVSDIYKGTSFGSVVQAAVDQKGVRAGLQGLGFTMVKAKASIVSKAKLKASVSAALAKQASTSVYASKVFEQSAAIAAVGINRKFFKDSENTLRASLESELTRAGVSGAAKIVRACFNQHGVAYAKDILTLARKLAAQSQAVRDNYVEALDMTSEEPEVDVEAQDEIDENPVTAALLRPATKRPVVASTLASAILAGKASLV